MSLNKSLAILTKNPLVHPDNIKPIINRLAKLTIPQIHQWADVLFLKLLTLQKLKNFNKLKQVLSLYIIGCYQHKIQTEVNKIQQLLVMVYMHQNAEKYNKILKQFGFAVSSEQILVYEESIFTKILYTMRDMWI